MGLFNLGDWWLFASSALGLWLVPAALGRFAGAVLAAFVGLGLFVIAQPELPPVLQPSRSVVIWFVAGVVPFLLLVPDLFARGRAARVLDTIPLRSLLAWSLVHVMALRHVLSALVGQLEPGFALATASAGFFAAVGAAVLWLWHRPASRWFRVAALFWNLHALITTLELTVHLLLAHPGMPVLNRPDPGTFAYFSSWPGALEALFWTPLLLCLHSAIFYKLVRPEPPLIRFGFNPERPS